MELEEFTEWFKTTFIRRFDRILKKTVNNKYEYAKAKEKIKEKAEKIAEVKGFINYLDNPLEGDNGLSILDQFIIEFEDEYTKFFDEHLNILEMSEIFGRDRLMTLFMYFINTGKILEK